MFIIFSSRIFHFSVGNVFVPFAMVVVIGECVQAVCVCVFVPVQIQTCVSGAICVGSLCVVS